MPNLVAYGVAEENREDLKKKFIAAVQEAGLGGDVVMTFVDSTSEQCDVDRHPSPYLVVRGTPKDNLRHLAEFVVRQDVRMDMEIEEIKDFIPAMTAKVFR